MGLGSFHLRPRSPLPLALLRIALGLFVLSSPELDVAIVLAGYGERGLQSLLIPPEGLAWLVPLLRWGDPWVLVASWATRAFAVAVILGLFTRWSLWLLAGCVYLVFGVAQLRGTVTHNMHLWWLLVWLAVGPEELGLSIDSWRKGRPLRGPMASVDATVTLFGARLLIALVYLFPGIAKLRVSGLDWASSENLRNQLRLKWLLAQGQVPWPRIDEWPSLLQVGGFGVLAFELGFVLAIWSPLGRRLAVAGGLMFHALAAHFFYIHFVGLWGCYVVFWDGPRSWQRDVPVSRQLTRSFSARWRQATVLFVLLSGVVVQGVRGQTQSWPFACYPDFAHRAAPYVTDLAVDVIAPDGSLNTLRAPRRRSSDEWGTVWRILGLYDGKPNRAALRSFAARRLNLGTVFESANSEAVQSERAWRVRYVAEDYSTNPEEYDNPPIRRRLVFEDQLEK